MMNSPVFCFLLLLGLLQPVGAKDALESREALLQVLGESFQNGADPYETGYQNKHQMMRDPILVKQTGSLWLFDNYRLGLKKSKTIDDSKALWSSALVDITRIENVSMLYGRFKRKSRFNLGHLFALVKFKKGGVVTPTGETNSLVFSYEAMRNKGVRYSIWRGILGDYGSAYILGSLSDVMNKAMITYRYVQIFDLELSSEQKKTFLLKALGEAMDLEANRQTKYHSINNSCITKQFDLLNLVLDKSRQIPAWFSLFGFKLLRTPATFWPGDVESSLKSSALIKKGLILENPDEMRTYLEAWTSTENSL
jgi:hypothetical protein